MVLILLDGRDKAAMADMPYENVGMNKGATASVVTDKEVRTGIVQTNYRTDQYLRVFP